MGQRIGSYARKAEGYAPWSNTVPWYWVALEGAVGVLIGLYFIFSSDAAASTVRYLIAALLIGISAVDILLGFRNARSDQPLSRMTPYWLVRGGAGVALGVMAVVAERSHDLSDADARKIIGYGLLVWGLIGLIGNLDARFSAHGPWIGVLRNALALLIGAVLLYNSQESIDGSKATKYIGYAALLGGVILLAEAYLGRRNEDDTSPGVVPVVTETSDASLVAPAQGMTATTITEQQAPTAPTRPPVPPTE